MTDFDRIVASVPVNRSAARVSHGSNVDAPLSADQLRENIKPLLGKIEAAIACTNDPATKKRLGQQKLQLQQRLSELRGYSKGKKPRGIESFFMDIAKERLTKAAFSDILREAYRRAKASDPPS